MRALAVLLLLGACAPYERLEQSCLNTHVRANYGTVRELPGGGFEVTGSGVTYTRIEVTQPSAGPTGDSDEVAAAYPKQSMRGLACRSLEQ